MNIRKLREQLKLSQRQLSDETDIPKHRIEKWEVGKGSPKAEDDAILKRYFFKRGVLSLEDNEENEQDIQRLSSATDGITIRSLFEQIKHQQDVNNKLATSQVDLGHAQRNMSEENKGLTQIIKEMWDCIKEKEISPSPCAIKTNQLAKTGKQDQSDDKPTHTETDTPSPLKRMGMRYNKRD